LGKIPSVIVSEYNKKLEGSINGLGVITKDYTVEDQKIMERLVYDTNMQYVWSLIPDDNEKITFFHCAWIAACDFKKIREIPNSYKSNFIKASKLEKSKTIKSLLKGSGEKNKGLVERVGKHAKELSEMLMCQHFSGHKFR